MGWTPAEIGACGLAEFAACWEGFAALHGASDRDAPSDTGAMTEAEIIAAKAEIFGE